MSRMTLLQSTKLYEGFSACFRQWRAEGTHCKFIHGYGISFRITFEGELDERNWVFDFGGMKRAKNKIDGMSPLEWFNYMFDHTTLVAQDDPHLDEFKKMEEAGLIQLRVMERVGAEIFAEFLLQKINDFLEKETESRVLAVKVEFFENQRNSAVALLDRVGLR